MDKYQPRGSADANFKNILIIIVAVAVLLLFAAAIVLLTQKAPEKPPVSNNTIPNLPNATGNGTFLCNDDCLLRLALGTANSTYCKNMSASRSDDCWVMFSHQDLNSCLLLRNYSMRKECLGDISFEQKNITLCSLLSGEDIVLCKEKINPPCMDIAEKANRELCLALRSNNSEFCEETQCVLSYAKQKKDSTACNRLASDSEKAACTSLITNIDGCTALSGVYTIDYCYQLLAEYTNEYNYCLNIQSGLYKYNCYLSKAVFFHNASYCQSNDLEYLWSCYTNYSLSSGDFGGCLAITDKYAVGSKDGCVLSFSKKYADPSACNELSTIYMRMNCYANAIVGSTNLTVSKCAGITQSDWKDKCFSTLAQTSNQKTYCEYVEDRSEKQRCMDLFGSS